MTVTDANVASYCRVSVEDVIEARDAAGIEAPPTGADGVTQAHDRGSIIQHLIAITLHKQGVRDSDLRGLMQRNEHDMRGGERGEVEGISVVDMADVARKIMEASAGGLVEAADISEPNEATSDAMVNDAPPEPEKKTRKRRKKAEANG